MYKDVSKLTKFKKKKNNLYIIKKSYFTFNSIKNYFAGENHKKVVKLVKKIIRKNGNKHFFEKSLNVNS
jgi:hypothetical protein